MSDRCCGLGGCVVDRLAAHLPRLLVRGAHRVVVERYIACSDVIAVRADGDVLAAKLRVGAREHGDDVSRDTGLLNQLDGSVDDLSGGAERDRIERLAEQGARGGLRDEEVQRRGALGTRCALREREAGGVDAREVLRGREIECRNRDAGGAGESAGGADADGVEVRRTGGELRVEDDELSMRLLGGDPGGRVGEHAAVDHLGAVNAARGAATDQRNEVGIGAQRSGARGERHALARSGVARAARTGSSRRCRRPARVPCS